MGVSKGGQEKLRWMRFSENRGEFQIPKVVRNFGRWSSGGCVFAVTERSRFYTKFQFIIEKIRIQEVAVIWSLAGIWSNYPIGIHILIGLQNTEQATALFWIPHPDADWKITQDRMQRLFSWSQKDGKTQETVDRQLDMIREDCEEWHHKRQPTWRRTGERGERP